MESTIISGLSALGGASLGAITSIATTWLAHHYQDRLQRQAEGMARRERMFGEFVDLASKLWVDALMHNMKDPSVLQPLYAVRAQICIFAQRSETVARADEVMRQIVDTYYAPNVEFRSGPELARAGYILDAFTAACRAERLSENGYGTRVE